MENTHGYKSWLSSDESTVYCEEDRDYAYIFLNSVVQKIMETKYCTIPDLIDFDCNIHRNGVKPFGYGITHGWTENQIQRMHVATGTLGYYVWLGSPVSLNDETEEKNELKMKIEEIVQHSEFEFVLTKKENKGEKVMNHCKEGLSCADCAHRYTLATKQPCCGCNIDTHSNYIPAKKENKGEKVMNHYEEDPIEIDRNSIIPKRIWFNEHDGKCFTTVEWEDGVKTTVSETLNATNYGGFTAALAKRIYGTGGTIRAMNQAIDKANEKKKLREEQRKQDRLLKQWRREYEAKLRKKVHEERVREEVERLRAEREAKRRILGGQLGAFAKALSFFDCGLDKKEDHAE